MRWAGSAPTWRAIAWMPISVNVPNPFPHKRSFHSVKYLGERLLDQRCFLIDHRVLLPSVVT